MYLAEDTKLGRTVALKILPPELSSDSDRLRRFVQEAKTASALDHPNVAQIYEIGEAEGTHFIAMQYVEGETLRSKIHGQPLDTVQLLDVAIQVADALQSAHSKGIVHRDLKSSNIMVNSRGQAKVLDFGLAKLTTPSQQDSQVSTLAETQSGIVLGTVPYMSPEQALGKKVDSRSDMFSFGVVLYEMTTGRLPFEGTTTTKCFPGYCRHNRKRFRAGITMCRRNWSASSANVWKKTQKDAIKLHQICGSICKIFTRTSPPKRLRLLRRKSRCIAP